jgi:tRNA-binding EMAP/Myf-like protein
MTPKWLKPAQMRLNVRWESSTIIVEAPNLAEKFVVGEIVEAEQHPSADRLMVCQVAAGEGKEPVQVICGAANVRVGMRVALAQVGARVWNDQKQKLVKLKKSKLRGVPSMGMLCSEDELGLTTVRQSGIMELPPHMQPGTTLAEAVQSPVRVAEGCNEGAGSS